MEVAKPDERSIMTYVAAFYHAFAGDQKVLFFLLFFFIFNIPKVLKFWVYICINLPGGKDI